MNNIAIKSIRPCTYNSHTRAQEYTRGSRVYYMYILSTHKHINFIQERKREGHT